MQLLPASVQTVDMRPDSVGRWLLHCHINSHKEAGMMAFFDVIKS